MANHVKIIVVTMNFSVQNHVNVFKSIFVAVRIYKFSEKIQFSQRFSNFSDNHVDCEAKGEDEIGCELTEDEIEKIKHECESNPEHVMCPMTLTCIKQSWFCGEILAKFLLKCKKIQYLFLV